MSNEVFDASLLAEKLSKLNNSQQSIESLSRWCISHRKKARQIVETWEQLFNSSQKEQCISFLYLANDILQNSRRKGGEYVNEFWKVLPAALKHVYDSGGDSGKKAATRLVDIWEERKVFGSRIQGLKDELVANQIKDPAPQVVSNGKISNPIKIVKKDAQLLRIKLAVGGFPERIVSAFHCLHDESLNEESMLIKCDAAVLSVERILKEVENTISQGIRPGKGIAEEMQEQEDVLKHCVRQLEGAEATHVTLVSLLKEAVQDQEAQLETLRRQMQIAQSRINEVGILRSRVSSHDHGVSATPAHALAEPPMIGEVNNPVLQATNSLQSFPSQPIGTQQIPAHQVSQTPSPLATSFAALATTDEENKKAAAAAVAAKLAASTSSAQMLTSVLSSLVAEEAASINDSLRKAGLSASISTLPPEKRQKLEPTSSGAEVSILDAGTGSSPYFTPLQQPISSNQVSVSCIQASLGPPPPPPPPPPSLLPSNPNQFTQSAGMMLNMMPYGFGANNLPPPPPLPSHVAMGLVRPLAPQSPQPLQPPQQLAQQQNSGGGFYRPPGIGLYGSTSQPSTPPMQRQ